MTGKQFFDWQTGGGTNDVMRLVDCLERADVPWCAIGGIAVNHWAAEPMVTRDVDFVVASDDVERSVSLLEGAGFSAERFEWSVNFKGRSVVTLQLSIEPFYREFPARAVAADVHGVLMRVASLRDTLAGKIKAWSEPGRRPSKRIKDLGGCGAHCRTSSSRSCREHRRSWLAFVAVPITSPATSVSSSGSA